MKKFIVAVLVLCLMVTLVSCGAGQNPLEDSTAGKVKPAGFLLGLWHGVIATLTFMLSIFGVDVNIYEVHNNGGWYNFGFLLGIGAFFKSGSSAARRC